MEERTFRYGGFPFLFVISLLNESDIGPRTLCNACGLVYAKLVCIFHDMSSHFFVLIFIIIIIIRLKKGLKKKSSIRIKNLSTVATKVLVAGVLT